MRSRTSRYALFDSRRNQRLATTTGGTTDEHAQRELPAQDEDRGYGADEEQHVLDHHRQARLDEILHRVDVRRQPGDEATGLLALEEVESERHEVVEDPHPQVSQERLADAGATCLIDARPRTSARNATHRYRPADRLRAPVSFARRPASMPWRTSAGPASKQPVWATMNETATMMRPRHGRSITRSRLTSLPASSRLSRSSTACGPPAPTPPLMAGSVSAPCCAYDWARMVR